MRDKFGAAFGAVLVAALAPQHGFAKARGGLSEVTARTGTAAYVLEQCPSETQAPESTEFLGFLAPVVAGFIGDFIAEGIKAMMERHMDALNGQFIARGAASYTYEAADLTKVPAFSCVVVARGEFGRAQSGLAPASGRLKPHMLKGLQLSRYPDFYLEAKLRPALCGEDRARSDFAACARRSEQDLRDYPVILQPSYLHYAATSAEKAGAEKKKNVAVVIGFTQSSLADDAELSGENTFALFQYYLGELQIGKFYHHKPDAPVFAGTAAMQDLPAAWVKPEGQAPPVFRAVPFNVIAFVSETEEASLAYQVMLTAFNSNKDALSGALEKVVKDAIGDAEPAKGE